MGKIRKYILPVDLLNLLKSLPGSTYPHGLYVNTM